MLIYRSSEREDMKKDFSRRTRTSGEDQVQEFWSIHRCTSLNEYLLSRHWQNAFLSRIQSRVYE